MCTLEVLLSKQAECCWLFSAVTRFAVASLSCMNELRQLGNEKLWHVRLNLFLGINYLKTLLKSISHVGKLDFYVLLSEREVITAEDVDNH